MRPNAFDTTKADLGQLAERITATLRAFIEVRPFEPDSLVARPGFWARCQLIGPPNSGTLRSRIFVDGFRGACQWNSLKVYQDALEPGLSLWCGFALYGAVWNNHAWCMLGPRIIETTVCWNAYYGAALLPDELEYFAARYGELAADSLKRRVVATCKYCGRLDVWDDNAKAFAETIGRERDWKTGELKEGLGR
jgi:hypothetical protein